MQISKLQLEKYAYQQFQKLWNSGKFKGLRYGQAFYNHFRLHRLDDQDQLKHLYERDGEDAKSIINLVFKFN